MYVLGQLPTEELPAVALQAFEDGYNSPSLCLLAGAAASDSQQTRELFLRALIELNLNLPSLHEAALAYAREIANDILRGIISPYDGAKKIWSEVYTRFRDLKQLKVFVGLASEYEDDETHRDAYTSLIVEECRVLLEAEKGAVERRGNGENHQIQDS
jgi:hypothetical protein